MSDQQPLRGRRAALLPRARRLDLAAVVAALLPVLTLGAALLVAPHTQPAASHPPTAVGLVRLDRGCPGAGSVATADVLVGNAAGTAGEAGLRTLDGSDATPRAVTLGPRVVPTAASGPVLVSAEAEPAVGLLAARFGAKPLVSAPCPIPVPELWFTGLGARSDHASKIELDNPDVGAAVVDITLYSRFGVLDTPEIRGIRVPGRTSVVVDLATTVPRRGDLGAQIAVSRGRAAVTVLDRVGVESSRQSSDWLPAGAEPTTVNLVLGLTGGPARRLLTLVNPGDAQAVASIKVLTRRSVFTPAGGKDIPVKPGATVSIPLQKVLSGDIAKGALGVVVESSLPLTAGVRAEVGAKGDLAHTVSASALVEEGAALVPGTDSVLDLAGASGSGKVVVTARDADGKTLLDRTVSVQSSGSNIIKLPAGSAVVDVRPDGTTISAAVVVTGRGGATVIPVTEVPQHSLLPNVGPALP